MVGSRLIKRIHRMIDIIWYDYNELIPGERFSKAPETFRALKAIAKSRECVNTTTL